MFSLDWRKKRLNGSLNLVCCLERGSLKSGGVGNILWRSLGVILWIFLISFGCWFPVREWMIWATIGLVILSSSIGRFGSLLCIRLYNFINPIFNWIKWIFREPKNVNLGCPWLYNSQRSLLWPILRRFFNNLVFPRWL